MKDRGEEEVTGADVTERIVNLSEIVSEFLEEETKLSEKQAKALVMKQIGGLTNQEIAEQIGVSTGASASSYVTRCRNKFEEADEKMEELEREMERWEKTKKLQSLINENEEEPSLDTLSDFVNEIELELIESEKFLIRVVEDGEHKVDILDGVNPARVRDREILDYKRIHSVDELFD